MTLAIKSLSLFEQICDYPYIEVPYSYNDFISFNEEQRIAICQAVILRQTGCLVLGFRQCDPDKFFMQESK